MKTTCRMCNQKFKNTVGSKLCNRCKVVSFTAAFEFGEEITYIDVGGEGRYMTQVTGKILDTRGVES